MKNNFKTTIGLAGLLCLSSGTAAFAGTDADIKLLQQQVQELIAQNQQLTQRIVSMEKEQTEPVDVAEQGAELSSPIPERLLRTRVQQMVRKEMRTEQEATGKEQKINDYVTLFGSIEGEAVFGEDYEGNSFSEFNIAEATLGFDAQMSDWVIGHLLAKYEGPDDNLFMDEANIWIGNQEKFPVIMTAGKFYMPFGNFETNMVQDTLTLDIGEINDYGLAAAFLSNGFYGTMYSYNGMKETGSSDTIKGFGAKAGYNFENDAMSLRTGVSWVNNIADAGGISDNLEESGIDTIEDQVDGLALHFVASYGSVSFISEYITALNDFTEIAYKDHGAEPKAWNTEFAYSTEILENASVFAIGYQGSSESVELGLPEARYIAAASMVLSPGTALTVEYCHDKDYGIQEGGSDEDANVFTTQLSYEF